MTVPDCQKSWIVMATLPFGDSFMRLSDTIEELNDALTERISIAVKISVDEVKHAFTVIVKEGTVGILCSKLFSALANGVVKDKFGVMWTFVGLAEDL